MLMAALKAKPIPKIPTPTTSYSNFSIFHGKLAQIAQKQTVLFFQKTLLPAWKFGDGYAADICVTIASFSVSNFIV